MDLILSSPYGTVTNSRMLAFIEANKGKISHILVYTLNRFSRTGGGAIKLSMDLREKFGVTVLAVTQPTDTSNPSGVFLQNIMFLFSELIKKQLSATKPYILSLSWWRNGEYQPLICLHNTSPQLNVRGDVLIVIDTLRIRLWRKRNIEIHSSSTVIRNYIIESACSQRCTGSVYFCPVGAVIAYIVVCRESNTVHSWC